MPQPIEAKLVPVILDYRCRRCQATFQETVEADDMGGLAATLESLLLMAASSMSHSPRARVHECPTIYGGVGIADLVGGNLKAQP